MAVGNDQDMSTGNWMDIPKSGHPLIPIEDGGGRIAGEYFAEDTVHRRGSAFKAEAQALVYR
jgi:hypothetical protein